MTIVCCCCCCCCQCLHQWICLFILLLLLTRVAFLVWCQRRLNDFFSYQSDENRIIRRSFVCVYILCLNLQFTSERERFYWLWFRSERKKSLLKIDSKIDRSQMLDLFSLRHFQMGYQSNCLYKDRPLIFFEKSQLRKLSSNIVRLNVNTIMQKKKKQTSKWTWPLLIASDYSTW